MLAIKHQPAVNLVRQDHDIAIANGLGNVMDSCWLKHAAGGILGRIQNDQPGAVADQRCQFVDIEAEIFFFAETDGHCPRPDIVNHRLVDGKAGIGEYDFVPSVGQGKHGKENNRLAARNYYHLVTGDFDSARTADVLGNGLPQLGSPAEGP